MSHRARISALIAAVAVAGCALPSLQPEVRTPRPTWRDTGTPPETIAHEREVRYYVDEQGAIWDDRGRKLAARP